MRLRNDSGVVRYDTVAMQFRTETSRRTFDVDCSSRDARYAVDRSPSFVQHPIEDISAILGMVVVAVHMGTQAAFFSLDTAQTSGKIVVYVELAVP